MVSRDGNTSYNLDNLNSGVSNSFYPTFSPFDAGGYYWLAFFSTRDYGNAQVGTSGNDGSRLSTLTHNARNFPAAICGTTLGRPDHPD